MKKLPLHDPDYYLEVSDDAILKQLEIRISLLEIAAYKGFGYLPAMITNQKIEEARAAGTLPQDYHLVITYESYEPDILVHRLLFLQPSKYSTKRRSS